MSIGMDKTSNRTDWMIFIVSTVLFILSLVLFPEWCWVIMPFMLTYLVKALNVM